MGEIWILNWEQKVTERQKKLGNRFRDFKKGLVESPSGTDPSQIIMVPFDTLGNVCVCVCVLMIEKFPVFRRPGQKASGMLASPQKEQAWIGETVSSNWCLNVGACYVIWWDFTLPAHYPCLVVWESPDYPLNLQSTSGCGSGSQDQRI